MMTRAWSLLVLGALVLGGADAAAQNTDQTKTDVPHKERPDDPRARPGAKQVSTPANPRLGTFQSIQVNVDDNGNNKLNDAANEPSIAIDPNDPTRITVGWRQFDNVSSNFRQAGQAYSHDGGRTWASTKLDRDVFRSDPVLDVKDDGTFYYYSLTSDFTTDLFISPTSGASYQPFIPNFGGDKNWFVVDRTVGVGNGHLYYAWSTFGGCCGNNNFTRSTDGGMTHSNPNTFLNSIWGTFTVDPFGAVYLAGVSVSPFNTGVFNVQKSTDAQNAAVNPTWVQRSANLGGSLSSSSGPNPGGLLGQVWIGSDHSPNPTFGNLYLLCSVNPPGPDPLDVHFSRSTDGGNTWTDPVRVNDDVGNAWQWFGTMSVAPNGRIDAIWYDTRNDPTVTFSEMYYASSTDAGVTWSTNQVMTPQFNHSVGYPNQNKLGDYIGMVSDEVGANAIFAATFNGEQDVYYMRIGPWDCNGNGVDDALDISGGGSQDNNSDGIPDECQTLLFSNLNAGQANANNTIHVTRATPGARSFIVTGTVPGSVPVGCLDQPLGMLDPFILGKFTADATGEITLTGFVPASASGVSILLQAAEFVSCRASNTVSHTFQ